MARVSSTVAGFRPTSRTMRAATSTRSPFDFAISPFGKYKLSSRPARIFPPSTSALAIMRQPHLLMPITSHSDPGGMIFVCNCSDSTSGAKIRLGMIGGGEGAFIGAVHRLAARMDDHYELVAGALSSTPERAQRSGAALGLPADRIYDDFEAMAKAEAKRKDGIEAVAIVTPNHMHAGPAYAFLKAGIHVICVLASRTDCQLPCGHTALL